MQDNRISRRYAAALFEIAAGSGIVEEIFNDLNNFISFCYDKLCLKEFLAQTYIGKDERFVENFRQISGSFVFYQKMNKIYEIRAQG